MADPTPPEGIETPMKKSTSQPTVSQWVEPEGMVACEWGPVEEIRTVLVGGPELLWSEPWLGRMVGRMPYPLLTAVYRPCDASGAWV